MSVEWEPSGEDLDEANLYWTIHEAMSLGPIQLAEQIMLHDPVFGRVLQECLERAVAMHPDATVTDSVTKVA